MVRLYLGILLAAMALGQALSWKTYMRAVAAHGLGSVSRGVAVLLFLLEVVVATGLFVAPGAPRVPIASLAVVVTGTWGLLALQAFVRRRHVPNCACFGRFMRQELRWWVLLEDAAFVGLAVLHFRSVLIT
jgi:hypothetical protein